MSESYLAKKSAFAAKSQSVFVLGATGEVGKELVKALLTQRVFSRVVLIGRRQINYDGDELYKDVVRTLTES